MATAQEKSDAVLKSVRDLSNHSDIPVICFTFPKDSESHGLMVNGIGTEDLANAIFSLIKRPSGRKAMMLVQQQLLDDYAGNQELPEFDQGRKSVDDLLEAIFKSAMKRAS